MIRTPWARKNGPSSPRTPKSSTYIMPAITGDTAKGRSIRVTSKLLPRKSKRAMAHEAARPKTTLRGTATTTTISVRRSAASVSASVTAAQ